MIEQLVLVLQDIIARYGAWGVLLSTLAEEIIAPIPSPFIPLSAGFLMFPQTSSWGPVIAGILLRIALPVAIGIGIGSTAVYAMGWYGGKPLIERFRRILGFSWRDVERIEERLVRGPRDEVVLLALRLVPILPGVALSVFCGVVRYPFRKFLVLTMTGTFVRATLLGIIGWQVGEAYGDYADAISRMEKPLLIILLIAGAAYGVWRLWKRRARRRSDPRS